MGEERAEILVFTDPPWNIAIEDNVSGLGAIKHRDFAMACGEMTPAEFEAFLRSSLGHAAAHSEEGALHYVCMHWSKMKEMLAAAGVLGDLLNLCVWNKTNAGMGSLYRSKHELVFVFKTGKGLHINNVALGRVSAATAATSGTIRARTSSMGRPRASSSCIRPPSPSRSSPMRSGTPRTEAESVLDADRLDPHRGREDRP